MKNKYAYKWLSSGISNFTGNLASMQNYFIGLLRNHWPGITGNVISAHSLPKGIYNKALVINVDDPIWIQELNLLKDDIRDKILKYYNDKRFLNLFDNIRFQNGDISRTETEDNCKYTGRIEAAMLKEIDDRIKIISDPELHDALRHYMVQSMLKYEKKT